MAKQPGSTAEPRHWTWERSEVVSVETVSTSDTGLLVRRLTLRDAQGEASRITIAVSPEIVSPDIP